jgi:hypothetical protein
MDGKPVAGEVLDRERARGIYESIVRAARDPGLLELVGTQLVSWLAPQSACAFVALRWSRRCASTA